MNTLFVDTLELALPISILIGILLLVSPLIKKSYAAKWRYFMWLFVAVRLILPFKISVCNTPITMELPERIQGVPVGVGATAAPAISLQTIFTAVWLVGIAVFAVYQLVSYFSFHHTVKRWSKPAGARVTEIFNEIKSDVGERRELSVRLCKTVSTPMVFGFIKPTLLLPQEDYTDEELSVILRHELIHFRRNDIWYKLVLITANALNWFNPLVYMMVNAANKDIELACDAEVVKEQDMEYRRNYCRAILTVVHNKQSVTTPLSTCFIISKNVIKERFRDILDLKKKRRGAVMFLVVALSAAVSGSLVSFATEKAADVLEDDLNIVVRPTAKPKATDEPVYTQQPVYGGNTGEEHTDTVVYDAPPESEYTASENAADNSEGENIPDEPQEKPDKSVINLGEQSNRMDIHFEDESKTYQSSNAFLAGEGTDMVVVSDGGVRVQIVDDTTGEVVREEDMTEDKGSITVPSGEYSINAVADSNQSGASIYVYGKEAE